MANNIVRFPKQDPEDFPYTTLAIDPGASYPGRGRKEQIPYAGCALFTHGTLTWGGLVKCPTMHMVADENGVRSSVKVPPFQRPNALVRAICAAAVVARHGSGERDAGGPLCGRCGRGGQVGAAGLGQSITVLACENPLLYKKGPARPQDIIALARIYGAIMGGIDADFYSGPAPVEWKGSIDSKSIVNERTVAVLNGGERNVLVRAQKDGADGLSDHVLDAVGVGLYVLGRMGTGGLV